MNNASQSSAPQPQLFTIRVAVGTSNPCKIEAVRKAFEHVFVDRIDTDTSENKIKIYISSFDVPSGVPDQPYGDVETREGAMNRAQAAYDAACSCTNDVNMHPDFAVGLEGGLEHQCYQQNMTPEQTTQQNNSISKGELWCMAWIAILGGKSEMCIAAKAKDDNYCVSSTGNKKCRASSWGYAKTGSFLLPPALSDLVLNKNIELGQADDMLFNRVNSKHRQGTVGRLTDGQIDRDEYYVHALKLALIPWIRPELYLDRHTTPDSMEQSKE